MATVWRLPTFARITPLEEAGLGIFVILIVESLTKTETEDFKIRVSVAYGYAICLVSSHGVKKHCALARTLNKT
jgi:hypothetical protein